MFKLSSITKPMEIKNAVPVKNGAKVVSKPLAKAEAKATDAMEAQGRAMVKQYQKPEIKVVKMEKNNMQATSGVVGTDFLPVRQNADFNAWSCELD